jgi:hypothetical protein
MGAQQSLSPAHLGKVRGVTDAEPFRILADNHEWIVIVIPLLATKDAKNDVHVQNGSIML